jgi:hypothetical protein
MFRAISSLFIAGVWCSLALGVEITGGWAMSADAPDGKIYKFELTIQQSSTLSATIRSQDLGRIPVKSITFSSGELTFTIPHPEAELVSFKLHLDGDSLNGTLVTADGDAGTVIGAREAAIAGTWGVLSKAEDGSEMKLSLELKQNEGELTGEISDGSGSVQISEGQLAGNEFSFKVIVDEGTYSVSGTARKDQLKGVYKSSGGESGAFTATRAR